MTDDATQPLVRATNVSKRFVVERDILGRATKHVHAVRDVSLDIFPGETVTYTQEVDHPE